MIRYNIFEIRDQRSRDAEVGLRDAGLRLAVEVLAKYTHYGYSKDGCDEGPNSFEGTPVC